MYIGLQQHHVFLRKMLIGILFVCIEKTDACCMRCHSRGRGNDFWMRHIYSAIPHNFVGRTCVSTLFIHSCLHIVNWERRMKVAWKEYFKRIINSNEFYLSQTRRLNDEFVLIVMCPFGLGASAWIAHGSPIKTLYGIRFVNGVSSGLNISLPKLIRCNHCNHWSDHIEL